MRGLILLLIIGCVSTDHREASQFITLKASELSALISSSINPKNIHLFYDDEFYTTFESYDYFSEILKNYRKFSFDSGVKYSRKYDCEDFARGMQHYFQVRYYKSNYKDQSFALGVASYHTDEGVNHALCIVVIGEKVVFIEPQNGRYVELSEKEKENVFQVVF